jgi:DNA-binding NarL/FixJ family response regulator
MLRVVLCDDERLALQRLRQLLSPHPEFQIVGEANSKEAALRIIRKEKPDALFLDGTVSSLYAPALKRNDFRMDLGPMIGVVKPSP